MSYPAMAQGLNQSSAAPNDNVFQLVAVMRKLWPANAYKRSGFGIWFVRERELRTKERHEYLKQQAEAKRLRKAAKRVNK